MTLQGEVMRDRTSWGGGTSLGKNRVSWRRVVKGFPARRIPDERNAADGDCAGENRPALGSREQNPIIFLGFHEFFTIRADADARI
jgi:hypothetical protein